MYFTPIEAVSKRITEIPISNGNFIINITDSEIYYDTYDKRRINISNITFVDTEQELLESTGIKNRLYIAKNTGAIYYWFGSWKAVNANGQSAMKSIYYVSADGSIDNDGLEPTKPAQSINQILTTYQGQSDIIIIVSGNISDNIINISNKNSITIMSNETVDSSITCNISLDNSPFIIKNLKINGTLDVSNSRGNITSSEITRIQSSNSNIIIDDCLLNTVTGDSGSSIVIKAGRVDESANAIITAKNGSIITIPDNIIGNVSYDTFTFGKIYKNGEALSSSEQDFISDLFKIEKIY